MHFGVPSNVELCPQMMSSISIRSKMNGIGLQEIMPDSSPSSCLAPSPTTTLKANLWKWTDGNITWTWPWALSSYFSPPVPNKHGADSSVYVYYFSTSSKTVTNWEPYNWIQFWHYLPGHSVTSYRVRAQFCKTAHTLYPHFRGQSRVQAVTCSSDQPTAQIGVSHDFLLGFD